jgi:hypothetical protein
LADVDITIEVRRWQVRPADPGAHVPIESARTRRTDLVDAL